MNGMTNFDVVKKLIGDISPSGDAAIDEKRFENLKAMCELMDEIHTAIDSVAYNNRHAHQASVKRSVAYVDEFLDRIGIKD